MVKEMGIIERYGTGIKRVRKMFIDYGLPEPQFEMMSGGVAVTVWGLNFEQEVTPQVTEQDTEQVAEQVTEQVRKLLMVLNNIENCCSIQLIMQLLTLKHRPTLHYTYIQPALKLGLIEMTIPDKPNSRLQKYRLTEKGLELKNRLQDK